MTSPTYFLEMPFFNFMVKTDKMLVTNSNVIVTIVF